MWRTACAQRVNRAQRTFRALGGRVAAAAPRAATRGVSVYSDALFLSHQLTHGPNHFGAAPRGPPIARISRDAAVDVRAFAAEYEAGAGTPAIIESAAGSTIGASSGAWDEAALRQTLGDRIFHAGGVNFRLSDYFDYAATNGDDQPLYLFDPTFGAYDAARVRAAAALSGRPVHNLRLTTAIGGALGPIVDPNMGSAWNPTQQRWLFFPPHDADRPDVDRRRPRLCDADRARRMGEGSLRRGVPHAGVCGGGDRPGDVTFVPRGWWHMVLNVAPLTGAVSHHFVSPAGPLHHAPSPAHDAAPGERRRTRPRRRRRRDDGRRARAADHARRTAAGVALQDRLVAALREKAEARGGGGDAGAEAAAAHRRRSSAPWRRRRRRRRLRLGLDHLRS